MTEKITPEILINAYAKGYFPMAESKDADQLYWFHPEQRGVIPLDAYHVPRSLKRFMKNSPFRFTYDTAFKEVMLGCADRNDTWINNNIIALYCQLHEMGYAHSIECWQENTLVGGVYGVAIGGAFCGESMFSKAPNASKAALVTLLAHVTQLGYVLFDTQYVNDHLVQFGVQEISDKDYLGQLETALKVAPDTFS